MKQFMDKDFLLNNETAKVLFHDYAKDMPVIDYHCHVEPADIANDRKFENITQLWLGGDHYKWRLMRSNGVDERFITGDADDRDKFQKYAESLPRAAGNPLYHWSHLELQRYFDCELPINGDTAQEIWEITHKRLETMSVRSIIARSNVKVIATTDDPTDSLEWHSKIRSDRDFNVTVIPCFRPDKVVNIEKPDFPEYVNKLSVCSGVAITSVETLFQALSKRLDVFGEMGCRSSDHALNYVVFTPDERNMAELVLKKALTGKPLNSYEIDVYKTVMMSFFGKQYAERGWVMQLHYGAVRDTNTRMFHSLGPDTGFDCIGLTQGSIRISDFLDSLDSNGLLPKTILYSVDPSDNALLDSIIGCFQGPEVAGKIQHGSAWWFNDTKDGIQAQLLSLAGQGVLGNFIGMLTDSRSFLSYTRHEYFRRILCDLLGCWVERGEYHPNIKALGSMVQDISYNNVARYFNFEV